MTLKQLLGYCEHIKDELDKYFSRDDDGDRLPEDELAAIEKGLIQFIKENELESFGYSIDSSDYDEALSICYNLHRLCSKICAQYCDMQISKEVHDDLRGKYGDKSNTASYLDSVEMHDKNKYVMLLIHIKGYVEGVLDYHRGIERKRTPKSPQAKLLFMW